MSAPTKMLQESQSCPNGQELSALRAHYEDRRRVALEKHRAGIPVVGFTSNTVPWELIRAAGFFPVLVSPLYGPTPQADEFMEPVFDHRMRGIFDSVLSGQWSFLSLLIFPRTSEWEYKTYLYLREMARQEFGGVIPPLHLYDLLHTRSSNAGAYGLGRTKCLKARLEELAGRPFGNDEIESAVAESNAARRAIRALIKLRQRSAPRLSGSDALEAIGAWYFMDRAEYAAEAERVAQALAGRPSVRKPRLFLKGAPLDHPHLHRAIERHGAWVVAEDDWWGSRSAGRDVAPGRNLLTKVFRKYYLDAPSPRVFPPGLADKWFCREVLRSIDGVIFYLPPEDSVLGWDYPRQRRFLDEHGIPHLLVNEEAAGGDISSEAHELLESFLAKLHKGNQQ